MRVPPSSIGLAALALAGCEQPAERSAAAPAGAASVTPAPARLAPVAGPEQRILAFGDSLFAGYGVGKANSYPAQLEAALRAEGRNVRVVNAGISGDTTAAGRQRLAFTLDAQQPAPDLVLLELGANDMLRALPPAETRANLTAMLDELRSRGIPVLLMGMRAPPNFGPDYQRGFDAIYRELGARPGVTLVPFWLETIYRRPELFQADRLHPTSKGLGVLVEATKEAVAEALPPPRGDVRTAA
ncbi:arylesterase [Qipengyuania sediminis]|uniref:arylesterase n=1 Tax=Qipengyuania sediminis TaxID=1532023 RepID=UPI00105970E8|nr:arylesterase [Qipengyuania sediminis]